MTTPGTATDQGSPPPAEEQAASVDRELLRRRAEAAAKAAALRYEESCGGRVYCTLVGQLRFERDDWPRLSDCEPEPQRWRLPGRVDRVRLLFRWDIVENGRVAESDNSVATLKTAEQQGVPLPDGWARLIADVVDSVSAPKGVRQH